MKPFLLCALVLVSGALIGCSDPKKTIIPSDLATWEKELKPTLERLSDEDRQAVGRFVLRAKMGEAFGGHSKLGAITVGEAITEQKQFEAEQQAKEAEQQAKEAEEKRLAEKLKAERDALVKQAHDTLSIVLVSKGFRAADPMNGGSVQDQVTFSLGFQNKGAKDLKGFKGTIVFKDMFGDVVKRLNLSYDQPVRAGKTVTWEGSMDFNPYMEDNVKLRDTDQSKLKLDFEPDAILFTDGTRLTIPESGS